MSHRSKPTAAGSSTYRRRSYTKKKTECFVGVVNLDELTATNGACLPEPLRMVRDELTYSGSNTALLQHALPMPAGHASRRTSYDETTLPPLGGGGGSGRSSSMPPNSMLTSSILQPYGVPSDFGASGSIPLASHRSSSMVMMGSMPMYHDVPNQNGKRPSMATSMPMTTPMPTLSAKKAKSSKPTKTKPPKKEKRWTWKKPKDMPKRPLSAYNLFFATERKRIVVEQEAALAFGQGISPSSSFEAPALKSTIVVACPTKTDGKKRPHRRTHGKISFSDLARTIADRWKALDNTARSPYTAEAAKDKARYDREMAIYNMKKDIEKKKAEQKRLEDIIAAAKNGEGGDDESKDEKNEVGGAKVEEEVSIIDGKAEPSIEATPSNDKVEAVPALPVPIVPPQTPPTNTNSSPFPRNTSLGLLSVGPLDDDLGFGNDDFIASLNNSHNLDITADFSALAQVALVQASSAMQIEQVVTKRPSQPPGQQPQQAQKLMVRPPSRPPSRSLDMLLEGTSNDRDMMEIGNSSFTFNNSFSSISDRSAAKKVNKSGASHIGDVSLPTPNVPLLHSAGTSSGGNGGNGGEESAYSDSQLLQDILASIDADERYGIGGGDAAPAIPSSLGGTATGDLVGNFVRGSAA